MKEEDISVMECLHSLSCKKNQTKYVDTKKERYQRIFEVLLQKYININQASSLIRNKYQIKY